MESHRPDAAPAAAGAPLLVLAVALAGLLLATEWLVRWLVPEPVPIRFVQLGEALAGSDREDFTKLIEADPDTFWRLAPDVELPAQAWPFFGRISNGQGLREDHEIEPARAGNEIRILFLGASNTFGFMLPIEDTYVEMIERRLAERLPGYRVECINAGVPGYGLFQGWKRALAEGFAYEPDLIVASFGWNDEVEQDGFGDFELHARQQASRPPVLSGSRLVTLVWRAFHPQPDVEGRQPRPRLWPGEYRDLLERFRAEAQERDADFAAFVVGVRKNALPRFSKALRTPYQQVQYDFGAGFTLRDGVTPAFFDTVPLVQELAEEHEMDDLFFDAAHPKAVVNERIAEDFVEWIQPWLEWRLSRRGEG